MNLQEQIRRILKEETKLVTRLRRRLDMLDYEVEYGLKTTYTPDYICRKFASDEELLDVVIDTSIEHMHWNYFGDIDEDSEEYALLYISMVDYINKKYGKEIKEYYHINCGN